MDFVLCIWLKMALGIYALLVICILMQISKSQNTAKQTNMVCQAQLSEINVRMDALQNRMDSFIPEMRNNLKNQTEQMKGTFNAHTKCEANKSPVYTIHYTPKTWMDADLSCKANGSHLVSFETVNELQNVYKLIGKQCPKPGYWTSARDLGDDNWIWRNSGGKVLDDLWYKVEPSGDGDCGNTYRGAWRNALNDAICQKFFCYICETP